MLFHSVGALRVHGLVGGARVLLALARGVGLALLVRRDTERAFGLHGLIGIVSIGQALSLGCALVSRFFVNAALALLLGRGVDAARVALAFCVDETL